MSDDKNPNHEMGGEPLDEQSEPLDALPVPSHLWAPINAAFQAMCKQADLPKGYQKVSFDRASGSFVIHEWPESEPDPKPAVEPSLIPPKGGKGKKKSAAVAACLMGMIMLATGCVTKYDDIVADFHTIQNGEQCTTVAFDQRKFNAETIEVQAISCPCDKLKPTKRLVMKAGESPEVMSCPAPPPQQYAQDLSTQMLEPTGDGYTVRRVQKAMPNYSYFIPSGQLHHQRSLASMYVPATGQALSGAFIGAGVGAGLASQQAARLTQSVQPFSGSAISTLYVNGQVPNWLMKP